MCNAAHNHHQPANIKEITMSIKMLMGQQRLYGRVEINRKKKDLINLKI